MKKTLIWIFAIVITLSAAVYQRMTGPTYERKLDISFGNSEYSLELLRSNGESDAEIILNIPDEQIDAKLVFRRYPSPDNYTMIDMERIEMDGKSVLKGLLPQQAPAGKLSYYFILKDGEKEVEYLKEQPVVVRFKGNVPVYVLIPHVILIFLAMLFSNLAGLQAIFKVGEIRRNVYWAFFILLLGGMIMGPVVQKFAFGEFWAGVPKAWDLTDNKTLIAFIFWIVAFVLNLKKENRWSVIVASVIMLIIFSIPHSMFGSELDYSTGKIIQGFLMLPL